MPTYTYKCQTCDKEVEIEHGIKEDPYTSIRHLQDENKEECLGPMKRLISTTSTFSLTGSGWTPKFHQ